MTSLRERYVQLCYRSPEGDWRLSRLGQVNSKVVAAVGRDRSVGYNLTISHGERFVWFRVAKVGSRSIYRCLRQHDVGLDVLHASKVHYPRGAFDGYFGFAFVRDPVERFQSCWRNKVVQINHFGFDTATLNHLSSDIANFVEYAEGVDLDRSDRHLQQQSRLIDPDVVDFVGRFERLTADFAVVAERIGRPDLELGWANRSTSDPPEQLDPGVRRRIVELYAADCERFDYG